MEQNQEQQVINIDFSEHEWLEMISTENKGRACVAKKDIPAYTNIIVENPLYYYDSTIHPPCKLNCEVCEQFYGENEEAIHALKREFRGHVGYVHLIAELYQQSQEQRDIFNKLDFCDTDLSKSDNLAETKEFIEKYGKGWSEEKQGFFDRFVSNSHGQTNPPDCGIFMKTAMINHSCLNNCFFWIEDRQMVVRSFKPIKQGQEVTVSYIRDLYKPRTFRQNELAYRGFKCQCERCKNSGEIVRVWSCPQINEQTDKKCGGDFTPYNNTAVFKCSKCGYEEEFLKEAKRAEKDLDTDILSKKHFKVHQDMDQHLRKNAFAIPEDIFEILSLQLIENYNSLFGCEHYPMNIAIYDVLGQRFMKEDMEDKYKYYFQKAYDEALHIFGEGKKETEYQKNRAKNPPKTCVIF